MQTVNALDDLSAMYSAVGMGTEAVALAQQVRDARVKKHGADHPIAISAQYNLARSYSGAGKMRQALALVEEARNAIVPRLGADHPTSLSILDSLARLYRAFGRADESVSLAEQVRASRMRTRGSYHPETISTLDNLGGAYLAADKPDKALEMYQQAVDGLEKLDFAHASANLIVWNLCDFLEQRGQLRQAGVWRRKWLARRPEEKAWPPRFSRNMLGCSLNSGGICSIAIGT